MSVRAATSPRLLSAGAIASAIAASICCFGPLVLAILGLGGGALLLSVEPYRPFFLAAATLFLGAGFYVTYRTPRPDECATGSACARPAARTGQKVVLWVAAVLVLLAVAFPYLSRLLF